MIAGQPRPALLLDWLTPGYDAFARILLRERRVKGALCRDARIGPGHRVLDLGAGTGTLAILVKRAQPAARIVALDASPEILRIARTKARRAGVAFALTIADATAVPYADSSFDRILSGLVFSLLPSDAKQQGLREAYRLLHRDGELLLMDFDRPHTRWGQLLARRMRRFEPIADNLAGRLPSMLQSAGFAPVTMTARFATALGTISILRGRKAGLLGPLRTEEPLAG